MKYTQQQALRLRKWADLMAYVGICSNKRRIVNVIIRYQEFIKRLEREMWNA